MRISDWSSDVCSSDLGRTGAASERLRDAIEIAGAAFTLVARRGVARGFAGEFGLLELGISGHPAILIATRQLSHAVVELVEARERSEEHTSELQSLMRISYAVFCLKKRKAQPHRHS